MYSLLVVDDEEFAVKGMTQGIDWTDAGITSIYEAYGTAEAMKLFRTEHHIDIMICDIEMPGSSGFDLTTWVNENYPETKIIFMTGHENFLYAQKALRLECEDYLLKPVEHKVLKQLVMKVLDVIVKEKLELDKIGIYKKYYGMWEAQKSVFIEHFWQDILADRIILDIRSLADSFQLMDLPINVLSDVLLILIKVEQWEEIEYKKVKAELQVVIDFLMKEGTIF